MKLSPPGPERRAQLTRARVMATAVGLADRDGIEAISMRRLAQELGVEAMSLYTHVRNKTDLLDGMIDAVVEEIPAYGQGKDWRASLRAMALGARTVALRHPWVPRAIETQTAPGPAMLRYINVVLAVLREGGFSVGQAHHALHLLGRRLLGYTSDIFDDSGDLDAHAAQALAQQLGATHPYVVEMALAVTHDGALGPCDDDAEFAFGLDFILDGLARLNGAG